LQKSVIISWCKKDKARTLYTVPIFEGISLQKRSGMARVVEGFFSLTCTPMRLSTNGMNHTCLSHTSQSWSSFADPREMEG